MGDLKTQFANMCVMLLPPLIKPLEKTNFEFYLAIFQMLKQVNGSVNMAGENYKMVMYLSQTRTKISKQKILPRKYLLKVLQQSWHLVGNVQNHVMFWDIIWWIVLINSVPI